VFEYFAGEQFVKNRDRVYLAAKGVSLAKEQRRPLVFVFYRETIINRLSGKQDVRRPRAEAQSIMDEILAQKKKSKEWQDAVIVFLPAREQPALTQLVDLPTYQLDEFSMHSTVIVVADPDGNQVVAEGGHLDFDKLAKGFLTASSWAAEERRQRAAKPLD